MVSRWEELTEGKQSADGFVGPCSIARDWMPYEVSIVSIPADQTVGVGRDMGSTEHIAPDKPKRTTKSLTAATRQVEHNEKWNRRNQ
jgi:hypothetical protein